MMPINFASVDSQTLNVITVAVLSLIGTIATVGYKYKNTEKKKDPNQVIFDQVNNFIAEQRQERDDLRLELAEVKKDVKRLTNDNENLRNQLEKEKVRYNLLESRFNSLKRRADKRDSDDVDAENLKNI